jgi:hypothetical protein
LLNITSQISPDTNSPPGYIVRTALLDILDIFEVNRKECARLLLEYPKWNLPGTFKPKPGVTALGDPVPEKDWQLESTIIEVRFPNPVSNDSCLTDSVTVGYRSLFDPA